MYDDVNVSLIPADAKYIAAYADGRYQNLAEVKKRFPKARIITIDVRGSYHNGDVLDVEPGDASNADAPAWFRARKGKTSTAKPMLYTSASNIAALQNTMTRAGIKRSEYFIWSAHYNGKQHICGEGCSYPRADGTQWTDKSHGRSLDESWMRGRIFKKAVAPTPAPTPHPTPTPAKVQRVRIMHCSGQFNDPPAQHAADALAIFKRASEKNVAWVTGTEGGSGSNNWIPELQKQAAAHGFRFFSTPSSDPWVAVNEKLIDSGWATYVGPIVVPGKARDHAAKKVVAVQFHNNDLGTIHVIPGHYLTKGRPSAKDPEHRQHVDENKAFAHAIGEYAKKVGAGADLVFYGGDQNIVDQVDDTFFGEPMITAWDELKHYENTGHGNIDVIARFKGDTRVKAISIHALDDTKFFYNGDHYVIEAVYEIGLLPQTP
jgi:hypothetical protein